MNRITCSFIDQIRSFPGFKSSCVTSVDSDDVLQAYSRLFSKHKTVHCSGYEYRNRKVIIHVHKININTEVNI